MALPSQPAIAENSARVEGDSAFGFSGMEVETSAGTTCRSAIVIFNNDASIAGPTLIRPLGSDVAPTVFVKGGR